MSSLRVYLAPRPAGVIKNKKGVQSLHIQFVTNNLLKGFPNELPQSIFSSTTCRGDKEN
jgi:hypothetical protein